MADPIAFRPRKYDVTREQLEAWRSAGESTVTIASRFIGCHHETVRRWLVALGMPLHLRVAPSDEPPGKKPQTKRAVYDALRAQSG